MDSPKLRWHLNEAGDLLLILNVRSKCSTVEMWIGCRC